MSNLDDYFRQAYLDPMKQRHMMGNPSASIPAQNAALNAMGYGFMQEAKQNKGLALQERGVATQERAQAAGERQFGQQMSLYNKALGQQERMGYMGLGAQALGAAGTLWAASDRTDMMRQIYGRGGTPALTQDQQVNYPVSTPEQFNTWVTSPDATFTPATHGGQTYAKWEPSMGGGELFNPDGVFGWANSLAKMFGFGGDV